MKKIIVVLLILFICISTVSALTLEGEIEVNWKSRTTVELEVTGGDSVNLNCSLVTEDNYQDYDRDLEVEVKHEGKRYSDEIDIDWKNQDEFVIETYSEDFIIDCDEIDSGYNDFDKTLEFTFEVTSLEQKDEITQIIETYLNTTESINDISNKFNVCDVERQTNYDKWLDCEEEGGSYKNELKHLQEEIDVHDGVKKNLESQINNQSQKINNLESDIQRCNNDKSSLTKQKNDAEDEAEEARKKAGNQFLIGAGLVFVGSWLLNRKDSDKMSEESELYPGD